MTHSPATGNRSQNSLFHMTGTAFIYLSIYPCTYLPTHLSIQLYPSLYLYICRYVCMYVCMYLSIHLYEYGYKYVYTWLGEAGDRWRTRLQPRTAISTLCFRWQAMLHFPRSGGGEDRILHKTVNLIFQLEIENNKLSILWGSWPFEPINKHIMWDEIGS